MIIKPCIKCGGYPTNSRYDGSLGSYVICTGNGGMCQAKTSRFQTLDEAVADWNVMNTPIAELQSQVEEEKC